MLTSMQSGIDVFCHSNLIINERNAKRIVGSCDGLGSEGHRPQAATIGMLVI
jgi:hypothetical protein